MPTTDTYSEFTVLSDIKKQHQIDRSLWVLVEGDTDLKLFSKLPKASRVKFRSMKGKQRVINCFRQRSAYPMIIGYVVDLDTDYITKNLVIDPQYVYNCYDPQNNGAFFNGQFFNDIEIYLINTDSLKSILHEYMHQQVNEPSYIDNLRAQLEASSRIYDSFFHAYNILGLNANNRGSFTKIDIRKYIHIDIYAPSICFDLVKFQNDISKDLRLNPEEYASLDGEANKLSTGYKGMWALSRGHTVTSILAAYVSKCGKEVNSDGIERALRLACSPGDLVSLPINNIIP
jgi:hypothetical protein